MTPEHLSLEAERLGKDAALLHFLANIRAEAVNKLVKTPANDAEAILRQQAIITVCDALPREFQRAIDATIAEGFGA